MDTNFFKATLALSLVFFLFFACQKEMKETRHTAQSQNDAKITEPGAPLRLVQGLGVNFGSTVGPDGYLFIPDALEGIIYRIDPKTGEKYIFASGLPRMLPKVGLGGITDVVFIGDTAYALVTLVDDPTFLTGKINGIYRIDGPNSFAIIADIGAFNVANPPTGFPFNAASGLLYSIETYRRGFLVTDSYLNRVLQISPDGVVTIVKQFNNIVPTGQAIKGNRIYISQAGPSPYLPEDGKIVSFSRNSPAVTNVASGAPLLVDVEFGRGRQLFALSQGVFGGGGAGSPAMHNTGSLLRVNTEGTFTVVADQLDIPTSLEIIGTTAYIITLRGEIWSIENIAR